MSNEWGKQPSSPNNQPPWGQQPSSNNQPTWGPPSSPNNQQSWNMQPPTNNSWQQQNLKPGQFQPAPLQQRKKKNRLWLILGIVGGVLVLSCVFCGVISSVASKTSDTSNTTTNQAVVPTNVATKVVQVVQTTVPTPKPTLAPTATPTPKPTLAPTATPSPTESASQSETDYKNSTTSTTVANLDKDGNTDQGKDVHFTSKILNFVKDSSGNTAGANVNASDSYSSSVIQVTFTPGTDITKLNEGDILEVWGTDDGAFSGTNAFGGTVQEVSITAQYMNDQTTNYQANS